MWKSSCGDNTPQGELQLSASSFSSPSPSPLLMSALHPLPSAAAATGGFYYGSPIVYAAAAPYMYSDVQHTGVDPLAWAKNAWHGFKEPKDPEEADLAIGALQADIATLDKLVLNSQLCQTGVAQLKGQAVKHVQLYKNWKAANAFRQEKKQNKEEYKAAKKGSVPGPMADQRSVKK